MTTASPNEFKLDPALVKSYGEKTVRLLSEHFSNVSNLPVKPDLKPGELATLFSELPSEEGKSFDKLLQEVKEKILPGATHWQHPQFMSYYPAASSIPAILSELITASIGSVGLQWSANPIGTELECVVMDWLMRMLHAEENSPFLHTSGKGGGLIQNTAGEALVVIVTAARLHKQFTLSGLNREQLSEEQKEELYYQDSSKLVAYMSDQTHFSGPKAARVAGIRTRKIPAQKLSDGNYGITKEQIKAAMDEDRKKGLTPCYLQLNYGSTNTCGYDDLASFENFASEEGIWLHVDAAYAGASLILPQFKAQSKQIQSIANSFNFNGSKWFLCGFDSAFLFVKDRNWLKDVFAATGDYMNNDNVEEIYSPEFKDWSVPLGRRFRALRIWMVLEYFGVSGMQSFIQSSIEQANWLRNAIDQHPSFEQVANTNLGLVCFKPNSDSIDADDADWLTEQLTNYLQNDENDSTPFLLYPSVLNGQSFIRVALGGVNTSIEDVKCFWNKCQEWLK